MFQIPEVTLSYGHPKIKAKVLIYYYTTVSDYVMNDRFGGGLQSPNTFLVRLRLRLKPLLY